jgi:hypothetical protein
MMTEAQSQSVRECSPFDPELRLFVSLASICDSHNAMLLLEDLSAI